jgi:hypothetical protein
MVDWNLTCEIALNQTLEARRANIVAWSSITVRHVLSLTLSPSSMFYIDLHWHASHQITLQVTWYCCAAVASAAVGLLWFRLSPECKKNLWRMYGLLCASTFTCCVSGAISWSAKMQETLWWYEYEKEVTDEHTRADKYRPRFVYVHL